MRFLRQLLMLALALTTLAGISGMTALAASSQKFTGEVSDSMCGAKHAMGDKAECTRTCVGKGSNYALVVGDKVYTLHTSDKSALDELNKMAGEKATVTGTASGDTIEVSKVAAPK